MAIDVAQVLRHLPTFDKFCSVAHLHALTAQLRLNPRFEVRVAGTSVNGVPIHHVRFGQGSVRALIVGFPHCFEPIGGLTVFALMSLLQQGHPELLAADVQWHIVPCIDPDGALLNEGWSQHPFDLARYIKNRYLQSGADQVDVSFPIQYKNISWDQPSKEAQVLQTVIDSVRPQFYFSLHNAQRGGTFYFLSRDIGAPFYQQISALLGQYRIPMQKRPMWGPNCEQFAEGFIELPFRRKKYDYLAGITSRPEDSLPYGAASWDYLKDIEPNALTLVAELGYVRHPSDESQIPTGLNLRQFKLRMDADAKFLASVLTEEWSRLAPQLDSANPLYRAMAARMELLAPEKLFEGGYLLARQPTREILFDPRYNRMMTEGERFDACMVDGGLFFLIGNYQLIRLLRASPPTSGMHEAADRLEGLLDQSLAEIARHIDFSAFEVIDCDTLAKVQLGSGLITLNSLLAPA